MLDRWELINKEQDKIEIEGTLEEILEELDVSSPEKIPDRFRLQKPDGDSPKK